MPKGEHPRLSSDLAESDGYERCCFLFFLSEKMPVL
jgi:hypothetical protein